MCGTCGCNITPGNAHLIPPRGGAGTVVEVLQDLLAGNDRMAMHNREHFDAHGVLVINLMSSPGAGKTSLIGVICGLVRPTAGSVTADDRGVPQSLSNRSHRGGP